MNLSPEILERLKTIQLLLLDVDGVLTDGSITYSDSGEEIKQFNARDGLGLRLLMDSGIKVGIITGRRSNALISRCQNLGIDLIFDGIRDKASVLAIIRERTGIESLNTAFVGDDLPDIPVMKGVGLSIAVADSAREVLDTADLLTEKPGGRGAIRQVCEIILKARGMWETIVAGFNR
ncbi:MAG: HAD hydrolase family protein [Pseudomonadota bacterium]